MKKFEVGQVYRNYYSTVGHFRNFECIKRTAKTVTFRESESEKEIKAKICGGNYMGQECAMLPDCAVYVSDQVQE